MTTQPFATTAVASKDDLSVHPGVLANNVEWEKAALSIVIAKAGMKRTGEWRTTSFWARGGRTKATADKWVRCPKSEATARVVRIECTGAAR